MTSPSHSRSNSSLYRELMPLLQLCLCYSCHMAAQECQATRHVLQPLCLPLFWRAFCPVTFCGAVSADAFYRAADMLSKGRAEAAIKREFQELFGGI